MRREVQRRVKRNRHRISEKELLRTYAVEEIVRVRVRVFQDDSGGFDAGRGRRPLINHLG
jgi:hypothetical protein